MTVSAIFLFLKFTTAFTTACRVIIYMPRSFHNFIINPLNGLPASSHIQCQKSDLSRSF